MEIVENVYQSSALVISHDHHYLLHGPELSHLLPNWCLGVLCIFTSLVYIGQLRVEKFKSFMSSK